VALRITRAASHKSQPTFCHKKVYLLSEPDAHTLLTRWRTAKGWSFSGFEDFQDISCQSFNRGNPGSDNYSENSGQISQFTPQQGEKQ
jgi:hypothetical protein